MRLPLAWLLALAACAPPPPEPQAPRVRNVVLLSIDTLRADHLEAYGYERPTSPFIAELAGRGALFEQAFAQAPWTLPSHGSMLMSRHPSSLGEGAWERPGRLPAEAVSIAEVLRDAGLRTRAIVNSGFVSATFGLDQGFEHYGEHDRDLASTVKRAERWLDGLDEGERFFLFLHTYDVHEYQPPAEIAAEFVQPYDGFLLELGDRLPMFVQDRAMSAELPALSPADERHLIELYDATIRAADDAVAELWRGLEQRGLAQDTLLILTSDHGEEFFEHGGTGHGYTLHDENLHVPLILVHPSLAAQRVPTQVRLLDLAPTIAALTGCEAPPEWEGRPLFDSAAELSRAPATARPAFAEQAHLPYVSLRSGQLKYIRGLRGAAQLYDLSEDPGERHNLAGQHPAEARLAGQLDAWIATHDAWPPPTGAELAEFEQDLLEDLRRLGYLGESDDEQSRED